MQRCPVEDGFLQTGVGKDAQLRWLAGVVTYQHGSGALRLKQLDDRHDVGIGIDKMSRSHECLIDAGHGQ